MLPIYSFLCNKSRYYGDVNPENLVFNANLQEFAQRVNYISCLASNGKISTEQAFSDIKTLWEQLGHTKKELGVGEHPFSMDTGKA